MPGLKQVKRASIACIILSLLLAGGTGCTGSSDKYKQDRPAVVPAEGVITYKGQPVEGATVVFIPTTGSHAASAYTDSSGRFSMAAFPPDPGVVPGSYRVTVTKLNVSGGGGGSPTGFVHDDGFRPPVPAGSLVPAKYSDANMSDLTAEVPEGGKTDFTFDLQD